MESIGKSAFSHCSSLANVTIPNSVTNIGELAFICENLAAVHVNWDVPLYLPSDPFSDSYLSKCTLYTPIGTASLYASSVVWEDFGNIIEEQRAESISITPKNCTLDAGDEMTLMVKILPSNTPNKNVLWTSNNNNVASVIDGVVTAHKAGTAIITAATTDGSSLSAQCIVTVLGNAIKILDENDEEQSVTFSDEIVIRDTWQSIENAEDIDNVNVSYSRTYKNTSWQAWYVPFGFTLTSDIASRFSFAKFAGTYTEAGQFFITLVEMQEGDEIKGNVPYFVQAKVADSSNPQVLNISNTTLYATDASGFKMLSAEKEIAIYGTYAKKVAAADDDWYAYGGGKYIKATTGQSLGAFRFYLTIRDREDNPYASTPNPIEIKVVVLGDEADGISGLNDDDNDNENGTMFNLAGQPVGADYKGVVIRNGKKVLIK